MSKHFYTLLLSFLFITQLSAQEDVLFTISETPVYASDFKRVYLKNLELVKDESQKNVDEYLKLFVNYKLKLKEAEALGLDEKPTFKREFDNYRNQLLKNYIYDTKVTESLVKEAYNRLKQEVNAAHILVRVDEKAKPEDTLKAYQEIQDIRKRAFVEGFDKVKKEVSDGRRIIGEDLGYFTAFKMVYDFENAAYNSSVGDITQPFRTRFGYHILKLKDKRPSLGKVTVAHIMINVKENDTVTNQKKRIDDIYKRLDQGEDFEALAKQFSEDKSSASKGGKLDEFTSGQLSSEVFEENAFNLKKMGDYSKPFKTQFGWHIIKLLNKKDVETYEYLRPELEQKIRRDSRSKVINASRVENLKKKYNIKPNNLALPYFESLITDKFNQGTWELPSNFTADKLLVKIGEKQLTYNDLGEELLREQLSNKKYKTNKALVNTVYERYLEKVLCKYQEDNLETDNKEFANIVNEFRDGLLIFDVMESQVWEASKKDTSALKKYYNKHKNKYYLNERIVAEIASSINKKDVKKVAKLLKKQTPIDEVKRTINTANKVSVTFTTGEFQKGDQALPKALKFKKGVSKVFKHNKAYVVANITNVLPKEQQSFEDAKGKVISDYQTFLEGEWLNSLKEKYKVSLNQSILDKVKSELKK